MGSLDSSAGASSTTSVGSLLAFDGEDKDDGVRQLVEELMGKSERLKAAAVASENLVAIAAGLRMPKPMLIETIEEEYLS